MLVTKHAYNAQKQARHALNAVWKTICTLIQQLPAASKNALRAYWKTQAEIFAYRAMIGAMLVSAYLSEQRGPPIITAWTRDTDQFESES